MRYDVQITELADFDLEAIYFFIEADNPNAAIRFIRDLREHCMKLASMPFRGARRDDIWPTVRSISFRGRVTAFYRIQGETVLVLRILYAGQQLPEDFQ